MDEPVSIQIKSPQLSWELEQLNELYQRRPDLVNAALRRLMAEDPELRWGMIVTAYLNHQINLGKAAELLEMDYVDLRQRFIALGIPLRIGPANLEEARAEVAAARSWFTNPDT
jgi:predicted HTH domain antitoxin